MRIRIHSGLPGPFSVRPAQKRRPSTNTSPTRLTSAPAYDVLVSGRGRAASGSSSLLVQDAREVATLKSVDKALVAAGAKLRRMRQFAIGSADTKPTTSDRIALLDEVLKLNKEVVQVPALQLGGSAPMPRVNAPKASALDANSSVRGRAAYAGNQVVEVDVTVAAAGTSFILSRVRESNQLRLTNSTTGQAQDVSLDGIADTNKNKVLSYDRLGVTITLAGPAESGRGALATALTGRTIITKTADAAGNTGKGALT